MSSCIRSKVIAWAQNVENLKYLAAAVAEIFQVCKILKHHPTLTTPLSGTTCHQQTSINLQAKFEVSSDTHYEDMKSSEKCRNWDSLGVRGSPFDRAHTTSYLTFIETARLLCTVFEI